MRWIVGVLVVAAVAGLGWAVVDRLIDDERAPKRRGPTAAPVSATAVERGSIAARRTYSGSLEAGARFVVSPKVGGRIARLAVDLADPVERGQVVAVLDDAEFAQVEAQAKAALAVAEAEIAEARSAAKIAEREFERITTLGERGVLSASQLDAARAEHLAAQAAVEVGRARAAQARASLEAARVRLGYTRVTADWPAPAEGEGPDRRVVAERMVDAGETVAAHAPLMRIVDLHPLTGVIHVTEADYPRLSVGQPVELRTDAFPDRRFPARIRRVAPVFREVSRQARVELEVPNPDRALKPGMFARVSVVLETADDALIVPVDALVVRDGVDGVFRVDGEVARWTPVTLGIRDARRVQIREPALTGRVVTLGQQLLDDGSPIVIAEEGVPSRDLSGAAE